MKRLIVMLAGSPFVAIGFVCGFIAFMFGAGFRQAPKSIRKIYGLAEL